MLLVTDLRELLHSVSETKRSHRESSPVARVRAIRKDESNASTCAALAQASTSLLHVQTSRLVDTLSCLYIR